MKKSAPVHGIVIPARRFTGWALLYFLLFFCLPLLALCFALDLGLYYLFKEVYGACYAVMCLFD